MLRLTSKKIITVMLAGLLLFPAFSVADSGAADGDEPAVQAADEPVADAEEPEAPEVKAPRREEPTPRAGAAAGAAASHEASIKAEQKRLKDEAEAEARAKAAYKPRTITVPSPEAKSIVAAMAKAKPGDTVKVMDGVYREAIFVAPGILFTAANPFKAVLNGKGRKTIVTMGTNSTISGFEIRNGTIGILSSAGQAVIRQCRIMHNSQSGIMCVGVLPRIEDNFIVYNKGSGIQGWDVRTTSGSVNHNTIAFNSNHGIALGGNTSITIENNIIAYNDQFGVKPGDEAVRAELINNNFYQNARISSVLPSDNMSTDPLFTDAKRLNFNLLKESRSIGQGTDNQNLGARILH